MANQKASSKSTATQATAAFAAERTRFKALLLSNPNYFGNLAGSKLKPVLQLAKNTFYEELGCVGYQPQQAQLEAVVYVKQPNGYGTDICGKGTPEYVRFYLSYDQGITWEDQGATSFQAHNVALNKAKRLEYAVSLPIKPRRKYCFADPLIQVRAILSWNQLPPANQPNWNPIWGEVKEAVIQIEPLRLIFPVDVLTAAEVKLPPHLADVLTTTTPIVTKPKALDVAALTQLYRGKDVPPHRFAFKELMNFATAQTSLTAENLLQDLPDITIKPDLHDLLFPKTDGNISFEELTCIGLDPNLPDTLVGILKLKRASGYSGGPCTQGSREYVTFWADYDNSGSFASCLGTAVVQVYDLANIPKDGVSYAVRLPVDFSAHRQHCKEGPKVIPIRAILSWNIAAPCANPNHVPAWGNREETHILIAPGITTPPGKIGILGGIPVSEIDSLSGLTKPTAFFALNANHKPDSSGRPCPFAGTVTVQGAPLPGQRYKVEVRKVGDVGPASALVNDLTLTRQDGSTFTHSADALGRFAYVPFNDNIISILAQWATTGDALWEVTLTTFDSSGGVIGSDTHLVQLDNTWPEAKIAITSGTGNCGKATVGTTLTGNFVTRDQYLGSYSLSIEPAINVPPLGVPTPNAGNNETPIAGANWSLNTTGMKPCGYIIRVVATDRAIIDSSVVGHQSAESVGFCLE